MFKTEKLSSVQFLYSFQTEMEMDGIETLLAKQVQMIHRMEKFFELHVTRSAITNELVVLEEQTRNSSDSIHKARNTVERFCDKQCSAYSVIIRKMHRNQLLMLQLLEYLNKTDKTVRGVLKEQKLNNDHLKQNLASVDKMFLADYQKSPFVSKMKPRCLSFLDFNVQITPEEFERIPKYMRGRDTLDELVGFLQTVIISSFEEKYSLLYKNKKAVTNQQDLVLWKAYNQQQSTFPNNKFITQGDIARKIGRLIDKKVNSKLTMLRHLHILQETRHEATVFYLWIRE
ncbi:uncharacterized protein LOC128738743 [Sabethes cyaneus]|uniref:uncharacterized protein LOC128738743 n=1 Tax=Sabethes cyaneus TaxID=53552 RepID=UPI00237DF528|nr:uncharacterized protein LOC128738743 [Sabethes cyaneus]